MSSLPPHAAQDELKRLGIALVLTLIILGGWQFFYKPAPLPATPAASVTAAPAATAAAEAELPRAEVLANAGARITIKTPSLDGSIALKGARFDDLTLAKYRETVDPTSPEIVLLSPSATKGGYFAETGWLPELAGVAVPTKDTVWSSSSTELSVGKPAVLTWDNGQGLIFTKTISVDEKYMFTIEERVTNKGATDVTLAPFGRIQRKYADDVEHYAILHEGMIGVQESTLQEIGYKSLREDGAKTFSAKGGWLGVSDKYWLTALIPGTTQDHAVRYANVTGEGTPRYQADFKAASLSVPAGSENYSTVQFFAGAKELNVLDGYNQKYNIPLFDRAVDFGVLYFLTKPIFLMLTYFYSVLQNFGLAILALTVVIKALMFPLANKSYRSMNQMKALQPKMEKLKERCGTDKMRFQQEMMEMYRKEKVNPASGCLPLLIQIPVFFALYKVLFVSIEMRHAPFFGWITDLSAPDSSNLFTGFGLIPWENPSFLHLGIWPILMTVSMVLQQKLSPKPTDPVQAKVMGLMPYMFLFLFVSFPVGLVIYWTWSNALSILQQWWLMRAHKTPEDKA